MANSNDMFVHWVESELRQASRTNKFWRKLVAFDQIRAQPFFGSTKTQKGDTIQIGPRSERPQTGVWLRMHQLPRRFWRHATLSGQSAREGYIYKQSLERFKRRPDAFSDRKYCAGMLGRVDGFRFFAASAKMVPCGTQAEVETDE